MKPNLADYKKNELYDEIRGDAPAGEGYGDFHTMSDGLKIFYQYWLPENEPDRVILCLHGMAGHGYLHSLVADATVPHGAAVYVPDLRGHGLSEGRRAYLPSVDRMLEDVKEFLAFVRDQHPGVPVFLLGESLGGILAINHVARHGDELAGIIPLAPALKTAFIPSMREVLLAPYYLLCFLVCPSSPVIIMAGREHHGIRHPVHLKCQRTDPLISRLIAPHSLTVVRQLMEYGKTEAPGKITIPTIIFQGREDTAVDHRAVEDFHNRLSSKNKTLKTYPSGCHNLMTDPTSTNVLPLINEWTQRIEETHI